MLVLNDPFYFDYPRNRSTAQALLIVVEKVKQRLIAGNKAGVVFFDFTDAFGMVRQNIVLDTTVTNTTSSH